MKEDMYPRGGTRMDNDNAPELADKLTSRQQEFLQSLDRLCRTSEHAVSYKEVAKEMGVSKWTAYDILHGLYLRGFIQVEHEIRSVRGRSQVLYMPVSKTRIKSLSVTMKWITGKIDKYARYGVTGSISMVARRLRHEKKPFRVVLYTSVMVILFARVFSLDFAKMINVKEFLASGFSADIILGLLGEFMFSLMRNEKWLMANLELPQESIQEFTECEKLFSDSLAQLNSTEKNLLVSVIRESFAG